jgi:hypothetical protein
MAKALHDTGNDIFLSGNRDCKAKHIVIVAAGYGGHAMSVLATQNGT